MTPIKRLWHRITQSPWDAYLAVAAGILVMAFGDPVLTLLLCAIGVGSWLVQRWVRRRGSGRGVYCLFGAGVLIAAVAYVVLRIGR